MGIMKIIPIAKIIVQILSLKNTLSKLTSIIEIMVICEHKETIIHACYTTQNKTGSIPIDDYELLQKIASRKRTSVSSILLQADGTEIAEERECRSRMLSIIGMGDGVSENGSTDHDEILYERWTARYR